uniref:DUF834 domain-containing protein n=1 Tax=Oryza sativa subsp. japonica TaxID=39947 RepID=Q84SS6_ORYSJ|nr:hypothetical protein [Oryza sativa Japonica Group]
MATRRWRQRWHRNTSSLAGNGKTARRNSTTEAGSDAAAARQLAHTKAAAKRGTATATEDGRRRASKGGEVLSTAATIFRQRTEATEGWTGFTSQLRRRGRLRRSLAMTEGAARPCRRSKRDGELRVDCNDGLPGVFDAREPAAGLALDLAEPREVAAQEGDGRGDGEMRLDQRPPAAKLGFTLARYF